MKDLIELNNKEIVEISAGSFWTGIGVSFAATFLYEVINDWDHNVRSFKSGYKSFK